MNVIKFGSDTKHRKQWFTGLSFSHPAKMALPLQLWLIENFTKEGETILDPMAGSGTILVACSMGRHVIAVELEQKFVDMMKGNWEKIQERGYQMGHSMGTATILQGDARNLTGILVDKIITSPPYEQSLDRWAGDNRNKLMEDKGLHAMPKVDKIITSPPYAEAQIGDNRKVFNPTIQGIGRGDGKKRGGSLVAYHESTQGSNNNIANLPYRQIDSLCSPQVDKIISSPPYEGSLQGEASSKTIERIRKGVADGSISGRESIRIAKKGISPNSCLAINQGYAPKVDAVISSPPYEGSIAGNGIGCDGKDPEVSRLPREYSKSDNNIGNLKADSYLSAMFQVYQQCYAVLRLGGLMILVVKNFIRNKQQVRLDLDTIKLCEQAGFTFQERWYRELSSQSFWRTIYHKKYPDVEPIKFEDILLFVKG